MAAGPPNASDAEAVVVSAGNARLPGLLLMPSRPLGLILLAEVSGSTTCSPANLFLARVLARASFASLVMNLLTASEAAVDAHTAWLRNDTALLAGRIDAAQRWLGARPDTEDLPLGLFAAGPASAAALAAGRDGPAFGAIVCCPEEFRPLPAGSTGPRAPTLLIAGTEEEQLRAAGGVFAALPCERELAAVPGAPHRVEERGALEAVADVARRWFERHLTKQWLSSPARP